MSSDNKNPQQQPNKPQTPQQGGQVPAPTSSKAYETKQKIALTLRNNLRKRKVIIPETSELWDIKQTPRGFTTSWVIAGPRSDEVISYPVPISSTDKNHMQPALADEILRQWAEILESGDLRK